MKMAALAFEQDGNRVALSSRRDPIVPKPGREMDPNSERSVTVRGRECGRRIARGLIPGPQMMQRGSI